MAKAVKKPRSSSTRSTKAPAQRVREAHGSKADSRVSTAHTPSLLTHRTKSEKQSVINWAAKNYL